MQGMQNLADGFQSWTLGTHCLTQETWPSPLRCEMELLRTAKLLMLRA